MCTKQSKVASTYISECRAKFEELRMKKNIEVFAEYRVKCRVQFLKSTELAE